MGGASVISARRDVERGKFESVYYVTGSEEILKDEFVDVVVNSAVEPSSRDFNVDVRSAADLNAESIHALVDTLPMLAERRVAVIRGLESWRKNSKPWHAVYQYVQAPSPSTVVILVHGAGHDPDARLTAHARHIVADVPEVDSQIAWIKERATRNGVTLSEEAANHLRAAVGGNLSMIAVEIEKLAAASEADQVDVADVERLVGVRHGETLLDWVNAVLEKEFVRAIQLLDTILSQSGMNAVRMLMTLGTGLIGTRLARAHLDANRSEPDTRRSVLEALRRTRPKGVGRYGDEARRWTTAAMSWSPSDLDDAIRFAYDADSNIKSTTLHNPKDILCTMLLQMAAKEAP